MPKISNCGAGKGPSISECYQSSLSLLLELDLEHKDLHV